MSETRTRMMSIRSSIRELRLLRRTARRRGQTVSDLIRELVAAEAQRIDRREARTR